MNKLDNNFWSEKYVSGQTGWDIGMKSKPITEYIDQLQNKKIKILIPGCGNAYDADYLSGLGYKNIDLLDISTELINKLESKFKGCKNINLLNKDFFEHSGKYDLIIEQTFFCSLHPDLREKYAKKMSELLNVNGKLAGVLFDREFEKEGPPFGGSGEEYRNLFGKYFEIKVLEKCYNSIPQRSGNEIFINFIKNKKQK